ncbi:MAG: HindVP family restriction endonuclease [Kiritimatiellia bacterium]
MPEFICMRESMTASLYGITHSNRNFSDPFYWGKNQFNSSFPVALACYMRDQNIPGNYLKLNDDMELSCVDLDFSSVFDTQIPNSDLFFQFESRYTPFSVYTNDELKPIDLVIKSRVDEETFLRPLEIKLTTLPDNTTANLSDKEYGCELVIRNPTTRYMALSMIHACRNHFDQIREIFDPVCHSVRDWNNQSEMSAKKSALFECLELFFQTFHHLQSPLLMQPVWKTIGKSAVLAENCLDIFLWSDFALTRLFMSSTEEKDSEKISRPERTALRMARCIYEVASRGKVYQQSIYDGMTFNTLNDKEFAISGARTNAFMRCDRLTTPIITKDKIKEIILGGGQKYLSPERRFDAIIFFSQELFNSGEDDEV